MDIIPSLPCAATWPHTWPARGQGGRRNLFVKINLSIEYQPRQCGRPREGGEYHEVHSRTKVVLPS